MLVPALTKPMATCRFVVNWLATMVRAGTVIAPAPMPTQKPCASRACQYSSTRLVIRSPNTIMKWPVSTMLALRVSEELGQALDGTHGRT